MFLSPKTAEDILNDLFISVFLRARFRLMLTWSSVDALRRRSQRLFHASTKRNYSFTQLLLASSSLQPCYLSIYPSNWKPQKSTSRCRWRKRVGRTHRLCNVNVRTKFQGNPSSSCRDISVCACRSTNIAINMQTVNTKCKWSPNFGCMRRKNEVFWGKNL